MHWINKRWLDDSSHYKDCIGKSEQKKIPLNQKRDRIELIEKIAMNKTVLNK